MALPERLLIHTALVERATTHPVGGGGRPKTWATVTAAAQARLQQGSPGDRDIGELQWAEATGHVYMRAVENVQRHDRLTIDGVVMDVLGISKPSVRDHYTKVIVQEIQRG